MKKLFSISLAWILLFENLLPLCSLALTSGPSQPEVQSFEPIGSTNAVDPFTGDFSYNIPLLEVPGPNGGYPLNLAYHSGISMDQEASWVGLGWNINPGAITRQVRGLPDDFKGEKITQELDMNPNITFGLQTGINMEILTADLAKINAKLKMELSLGIKYNNYKGVGYDLGIGLNGAKQFNQKQNAALGFKFKMDSQEGISLDPEIGLASKGHKYYMGRLTAEYNSRTGLKNVSLGIDCKSQIKNRSLVKTLNKDQIEFSSGAGINFSNTAYVPHITMPMKGGYHSVFVKGGADFFYTNPNLFFKGYYNDQRLENTLINKNAFGMMYLENAKEESMMDVNREKDGTLKKEIPNLPSPSMTGDIFTIQGQGVGGVFQTQRSDIGILHDPKSSSSYNGVGLGFEGAGGQTLKVGANVTVNNSESSTGMWSKDNELGYSFKRLQPNNPLFESYYFKTAGEYTTRPVNEWNYIGGTEPVRVKLESANTGLNKTYIAKRHLITKSDKNIPIQQDVRQSREKRNSLIQCFTNEELSSNGLKEYASSVIDRKLLKKDQIGGISVLNPDGFRYIYGLPAQNGIQKEVTYNTSKNLSLSSAMKAIDRVKIVSGTNGRPEYNYGSDKYFQRITTPSFTHSFLITAIFSPDYVDINENGPDDEDFGYWVKFNYQKKESNYKWRVPFIGANFIENNKSDDFDDKASYMYGEKEIWHLSSVETKTHIAVFKTSQRKDARGAKSELNNDGTLGDGSGYSYKLDKIQLYNKSEYLANSSARAIKTIHFEYTYELCPGVHNFDASLDDNFGNDITINGTKYNAGDARPGTGKLTLKKLWFTYDNSTRGRLNPYTFNYNEEIPDENPAYHTHSYDRWGNYKPVIGYDLSKNFDFPYVNQNIDEISRKTNSGAWNLKQIMLPSGADMNISYESDDYAYVQNKRAMQMFEIAGIDTLSNGIVWKPDSRIIIKLAVPIKPGVNIEQDNKSFAKSYLEDVNQVYFKILCSLNPKQGNKTDEFIRGYANLHDYGLLETDLTAEGNYQYAWIGLKPEKAGNGNTKYHPFRLSSFQHLRVNQPELVMDADNLKITPGQEPTAGLARKKKIMSLVSMVTEMKTIFKGYNNYLNSNGWCKEIKLDKSIIRLNNPNYKKYGGGSRVCRIAINDNWLYGKGSSEYGQVYEYGLPDGTSSGVAQYEPEIGGDENPFREAKKYPEHVALLTDNNLFFEKPVNENYFPAPVVGYSRVTVKSIASQIALKNQTSTGSGATVYTFYTAKDFPVLVNETRIEKHPLDFLLTIPFIGTSTVNNLTASQGYSIELNDMHGKPESVLHYSQSLTGKISEDPVSGTKYHYKEKPWVYENKPVRILDNEITTISEDGGAEKKELMGVNYEFFTDMRESSTEGREYGVDLNNEVSILLIPILLIAPWPTIGKSTSQARTVVTNKIIQRTGVLIKTENLSDGRLTFVENKIFDSQTGEALLTTFSNEFDSTIYNYHIPARWNFKGMDAAFSTADFKFYATCEEYGDGSFYLKAPYLDLTRKNKIPEPYIKNILFPGDEFLIQNQYKSTFLGFENNGMKFHSRDFAAITIPSDTLLFRMSRPGKRNLLSQSSFNVSALKNPLKNRVMDICTQMVNVPYEIVDSVVYDTTRIESTILVPDSVVKVPRMNTRNVVSLLNYQINNGGLQNADYINNNPYWKLLDSTIFPEYFMYRAFASTNGIFDFILFDSVYKELHLQLLPANYSVDSVAVLWDSIVRFENPRPHNMYRQWGYFDAIMLDGSIVTLTAGVIGGEDKQNDWIFGTLFGYDSVITTKHLTVWKEIIEIQSSTPVVHYTQISILDTSYHINKVINASAVSYHDNWGINFREIKGIEHNTLDNLKYKYRDNLFGTGERGIWRPYKTFIIQKDRLQSNEIIVKRDGVFDDMAIFKHENDEFLACNPYWIKNNEVTKYNSNGYEIENKDVLNLFSTAIYSYNGTLATAIVTNSKYNEAGFESFEEYIPATSVNKRNLGTGHISFFTGGVQQASNETEVYKVLQAYEKFIRIENPGIVIPPGTDLLVDVSRYSCFCNTRIYGYYKVIKTVNADENSIWIELNGVDFINYKWKGSISFNSGFPAFTVTNNVAISNEYAHTGNNCLKIEGTTSFKQENLKLIPGKEYVLQAWAKSPATQTSYQVMQLSFMDKDDNFLMNEISVFTDKLNIDDWKKVEKHFKFPASAKNMKLTFSSNIFPFFIDDIRIFPKDGNMKSYVYDRVNFRLKASQDENNFATMFSYDEEGNLVSTKQETINGVLTTKEIHKNVQTKIQ